MHTTQRQQATERLEAANITHALFASQASVTWLTGFAPPIQLGQHQFAGGPALVWYADKHFYLIVLDWQVDDASAFGDQPDGSVLGYEGYTIENPISSEKTMRAVFEKLIDETLPSQCTVGVEQSAVTAMFYAALLEKISADHDVRPIDDLLIAPRMIKTDEELAKLRENFRLTDLGHATAREAVAPGKREIDVWMEIHTAINRVAGQRVPLGNDLVVGSRSPNNIGGWALDHEIRAGDTVTVDLSTAYKGYWSDSCASYFAGGQTEAQAKVYQVVSEALDYAISLIRPGVVAKDVDAKVRAFIEKSGYPVYPHHTGHGVGTTVHEEPRIVPYNDVVLQPGMVIMLEPGIYFPGQLSIRHEDALLVTQDGAEILTTHQKR